jgi:hypothetical protein
MKNGKTVTLGKFNVSTGKVVVSDPDYKLGTWCQAVLENVKNGIWTATVVQATVGVWGRLNVVLTALHETEVDFGATDWILSESQIGADRPKVGIYDSDFFGNDDKTGPIQNKFGLPIQKKGDKFKVANSDLVDCKNGAGVFESGVVSLSGLGVGVYPLEILINEKEEIIGMRIVFIDDEQ